MKHSVRMFCLCTHFSKKIQVIHRGKVFFSSVIKSLSGAFDLHRKTIQSIMNKSDDQNDKDSENIETKNSTSVDSLNADIMNSYYPTRRTRLLFTKTATDAC